MNQALPAPNQPSGTGLADLVEEFDLGSARGGLAGARNAPLAVEVIRPLTETDLPAILSPPLVAAPLPVIKSIRASHHKLAQLIAEGKAGTEISLVTGYSQPYISTLQGDPAFEELVAYYSAQRTEIFIDAQERLRTLGLDATEKLHENLHDPTKVWSHRELMEVIKLALPAETSPKPALGGKFGVAFETASGGSLEIKFVGARPPAGAEIQGQFTDITPGQGEPK